MSEEITLRLADATDAAAIRAIYAPYVADSAVSFETDVPSVETMAQRIRERLSTHPWLVACRGNELVGYAYASPHRERAAYAWSCEVTAYVAAHAAGRGIGKRLYAALCTLLKMQHYVNAFGIIALPNPASVALHEACDFRHAATFIHAGYKCGAWHDVGWWQCALRPAAAAPESTIPFSSLPPETVRAILNDRR